MDKTNLFFHSAWFVPREGENVIRTRFMQAKRNPTAEALCSDMAKKHYENFPVGRFIRKDLRPHVHAIYAFARTADDFADEAEFEGHRLERLGEWRELLYQAKDGKSENPIFCALANTIEEMDLPVIWLDHLIQAFEWDVRFNRHPNFQSLLQYSQKSANPVGRMVLWLHGYREEEMFMLSDSICTALQLTNFWQDIAIDWKKDRVYLPQEDMQKYGYSEEKISQGVVDDSFYQLMDDLWNQTKALFENGKPLCKKTSGRLAFELKMTWQGGYQILERVRKANFDVYRKRPTLGPLDWIRILHRSLFWKA